MVERRPDKVGKKVCLNWDLSPQPLHLESSAFTTVMPHPLSKVKKKAPSDRTLMLKKKKGAFMNFLLTGWLHLRRRIS